MLVELYVENFILMDKVRIPFQSGLNIITGETGSGKSMLLGAINLLLGARFNKESIKDSSKKTIIQGAFELNDSARVILDELGFDIEDDIITICRQWDSSGKQISRVNDRIVTISIIKRISDSLIQIHGQHENQILLDSSKHLGILDSLVLSENDYASQLDSVSDLYNQISDISSQIDELIIDPSAIQREIEIIKYQIDEIDAANLEDDEDEKLTEELEYLRNFESISNVILEAQQQFSSDIGIQTSIGQILTQMQRVQEFDKNLTEISSRLESVYYEVESIASDINSYSDECFYDEARLNFLEARLTLIEDLKRKYGNSIQKINEFYNDLSTQLDNLNSQEQIKDKLENELMTAQRSYDKLAKQISGRRQEHAHKFAKLLNDEIHQLNMKDADFKVDIQKSENRKSTGYDNILFIISTNSGQSHMPLKKVISGGELSRMMLGIKHILGMSDDIATLVFDEIDTGISGHTAHVVADKLNAISSDYQIICITHLPQIAAMADNHMLIEKISVDAGTVSKVKILSDDEKIIEIARLSGGDGSSKSTIEHAQNLWNKAQDKKLH